MDTLLRLPLGHSNNECGHGNIEALGYSREHQHRWIPNPALDTRQVGAVETGGEAQLLLRKPGAETCFADVLPHFAQHIVLSRRHPRSLTG